MFIGFLQIIDYSKYKANQIYLKYAKIFQDVMSICYQKIICINIILMTIIFGGLNVFTLNFLDD
jgi:hypothetical protein